MCSNYGPTIFPQQLAAKKGFTQILWLSGTAENPFVGGERPVIPVASAPFKPAALCWSSACVECALRRVVVEVTGWLLPVGECGVCVQRWAP